MRKVMSSIVMLAILFAACPLYAAVNPWAESYRLERLYQYDAAISALNGVSSDNELVLLRRGWLYYLKGSNSKSIEYYQKAMRLNRQSLDAQLGIILPLLAQQRWREAANYANGVLKVAPWNYYAHIRLMIVEQALKQWRQLAQHARAVSAHYPTDIDALIYEARAEQHLRNAKEAARLYKKVLELAPDNNEARQFLQ